MSLLLNSANVLTYLSSCGLTSKRVEDCSSEGVSSEGASSQHVYLAGELQIAQLDDDCSEQSATAARAILDHKSGKNFNLRVRYGSGDWLVKQERHSLTGEVSGEIWREQQFFQLLDSFPILEGVRSQVIPPLHFDADNAIIIFPYLSESRDLSDFYSQIVQSEEGDFPTDIAAQLGGIFATLHASTFHHQECKAFAMQAFAKVVGSHDRTIDFQPDFLRGLRRLTPESFCVIPTDALKFFRFYQRYPAIGEAVEQLNGSFDPCCIVHNDPRFANFLQTKESNQTAIKPIDWEKWTWGDPIYDLARLISNYLQLWLNSLPISAELDLATILNRASVPLSKVQPSTAALVKAYLARFPDVLQHRPDFVQQLVRFAGLALLRQVQLYISQKRPCMNAEMAIAQVAKTLLCQPEIAISTVFGCDQESLEAAVNHESGRDCVRNGPGENRAHDSRAEPRRAAQSAVGAG